MPVKKIIFLFCLLFLSSCQLNFQKAGIEILTTPSAKVYINGKEAGDTPYKNTSLKPGLIEISLIPSDPKLKKYSKSIKLENLTNTVINWKFGQNESSESGYVLRLEKLVEGEKSNLVVYSNPNNSAIIVDGQVRAFSPNRIEQVEEGDRKVLITYPNYTSLIVFVKSIVGYQVIIEAKLEKSTIISPTSASAPTPSTSLSLSKTTVEILKTGTGWLRVRQGAGSVYPEITKVNEGDSYELLESVIGWYKIKVKDGVEGWISSDYARKVEKP